MARHSKLETTMETQTHLRLVDLEGVAQQAGSTAAEVLGRMLGPWSAATPHNDASPRTKGPDDDGEDDPAEPATVAPEG